MNLYNFYVKKYFYEPIWRISNLLYIKSNMQKIIYNVFWFKKQKMRKHK